MSQTFAAAVCALVAALLFACASVAQQSAAAKVPEGDALMSTLLRSPRWWAGVVGDGGGYLMQVVALSLGSVLLVQPLLVSALLFALPISAKLGARRLSRRTWVLAVGLTLSLAVFLVVGDPSEGNIDAPLEEWFVPISVVVAVVIVCVGIGLTRIVAGWRALALGAASGICYGVAVAFTKYVVELFSHDVGAVVTSWQTWGLLAAGVVGVYLQQRAFQVGPLSASLPALTIGEPIAAVYLGITVLDERVRAEGLGFVLVCCAIVVMLLTTIGLSRSQAGREAPAPPAAPVPS
ncbi:MAG: DMT family transporter [Rhodococcus sp.]|nr:DMT family transporter [Rhodococcus sp. (in: high G+C Gram-positive bacteria)]